MSTNGHIRVRKSPRAEKFAGILGKKSHVHRVIILKQMADHKLNDPTVRVSDGGKLSLPLRNKLFIPLTFLRKERLNF